VGDSSAACPSVLSFGVRGAAVEDFPAPSAGTLRGFDSHRLHLRPRPGSLRCKGIAVTMRRMASQEGRRSQLLRGVLDLCLLAVIEEEPAYGY
jgi:hypothetical protein